MTDFPVAYPLDALTRSQRAIDLKLPNVPNAEQTANLARIAAKILEPIRLHFGKGPKVTSGFRGAELNAHTPGASKTSQHAKGEAVDITTDGKRGANFNNAEVFEYIRTSLPFDQLIWEHGTPREPDWVHVSHVGPDHPRGNRGQVLRAKRNAAGKTVYENWKAAA